MGTFDKLFGKKDVGANEIPAKLAGQIIEAKRILGERNVFGPDEWKRVFGRRFRVASVPEIPWSPDVLGSPGTDQQHFLFLGVDVLDAQPLDLHAWGRLYPGEGHPKLLWIHFTKPAFAERTCQLRWYMIVFRYGEHWAPYENLVALLPDGYEVPGVTELVTAAFLHYLVNGRYPDTAGWMLNTSDRTDDGRRVIVRIDESEGAHVIDNFRFDDGSDMLETLGIAASLKLP